MVSEGFKINNMVEDDIKPFFKISKNVKSATVLLGASSVRLFQIIVCDVQLIRMRKKNPERTKL